MKNNWKEKTLVSCLESLIDYRGKTPKKSKKGIVTLSAKSVKMGLIDYSQAYFISEKEYQKFMVRGFPKKGDILMTTEAPLGCIAKLDRSDVAVAQRLLTLRGEDGVLDNDYLLYYLSSKKGQHELLSRASGSTVSGIKRSEFEKVKILLPSLPEQKAIAGVLSSLDDKIELLREQNKTLEATAQTIFKEWFGKYQIGDDLPDGWKIGNVHDIVDIFDSQRIPLSSREREKRRGKYPYYGATKIMDYVDDYIFDGTYLLFAEDGSVMDDNGFPVLQYVWGKFWVNNHTHVLQGKNGFSTEVLYLLFKRRKISGIINGAVQLKINKTNLLNLEILIPNARVTQSIENVINPIFQKLKTNNSQIQTLTKTRDTLLPKLMSGEIKNN